MRRPTGEHPLVELVGPPGRLDLVEGDLASEGVEREEADREEQHDEDHPPANRLAKGVARDRERVPHAAAPTASR